MIVKGTTSIKGLSGVLLACLLLFSPGRARASSIVDVAFTAGGTHPTGAAVIGSSGDYWNVSPGAFATNLALDNTGDTSAGFTLNESATNGGSYNDGSSSLPNSNLTNGYLYGSNTNPITMTLTGLNAGEQYDLLVYTAGDPGAGNGRPEAITVDSLTTLDATANGGGSSWNQGVNYVEFVGIAGSSTLTISAATTNNTQPQVNGFQLEDVGPAPPSSPEPGSIVSMATGVALIGTFALRRKRVGQANR